MGWQSNIQEVLVIIIISILAGIRIVKAVWGVKKFKFLGMKATLTPRLFLVICRRAIT